MPCKAPKDSIHITTQPVQTRFQGLAGNLNLLQLLVEYWHSEWLAGKARPTSSRRSADAAAAAGCVQPETWQLGPAGQ